MNDILVWNRSCCRTKRWGGRPEPGGKSGCGSTSDSAYCLNSDLSLCRGSPDKAYTHVDWVLVADGAHRASASMSRSTSSGTRSGVYMRMARLSLMAVPVSRLIVVTSLRSRITSV